MAANRNNDTGARNRWRANVADGLRASAEHRRCPECGRGGAVSRTVGDGGLVLRACRYCEWAEARYLDG